MLHQITPSNYPEMVESHYWKDDLDTAILTALQQSKKDVAALQWDDLSGCDHLHLSGLHGSLSLAKLASLTKKTCVLDIGSGLGGPARMLAKEFGCLVTGLDLTRSFLQTAEMLTLRTGLVSRVSFRYGNALSLPFDDDTFDAVWMQHVSMNVPDKKLLFEEAWRVLKPRGRLALHSVLAGEAGPIHYPVIWAVDRSIDFIEPKEVFREAIAKNGFQVLEWRNISPPMISDLQRTKVQMVKQNSQLLCHALYIDNFIEKRENMLRNLEENRIVVIQAVCEKR